MTLQNQTGTEDGNNPVDVNDTEQSANDDADMEREFRKFAKARDAGLNGGQDDEPDDEPGSEDNDDPDGDDSATDEEQPDAVTADGDTNAQAATNATGQNAGSDGNKQTAAPDIWANATPEQKAAFEQASAEVERWRTQSNRYAGIYGSTLEKVRSLTEQVENLKLGATKAQGDAIDEAVQTAKSDDGLPDFESAEWKHYKEDYPDIAAMMERMFKPVLAETITLRKTVDTLNAGQNEVHLNQQEELLARDHPDWMNVRDNPAFQQWCAAQPRYVQEALQRNANGISDAREASDILAKFKRETTAPANSQPANGGDAAQTKTQSQKRAEQLDANRSTTSRGGSSASGAPADDFDANFRMASAQRKRGLRG